MEETIYAFATPDGRSALAVLRISGAQCSTIIGKMMARTPLPRRATLLKLRDPLDAAILDQAVVVWSPGPASFTGEDCLELHIHGGRAVRKALLASLSTFPECRLAEPGEFTRRAFFNGKTDLTRIEGLADLLDAETEVQRRQAFAQLDGVVWQKCEEWRSILVKSMALLEATIDFSDEGDAPVEVLAEVQNNIRGLLEQLERELLNFGASEIVRDGFRVAIVGQPNVGKSTLFNTLVRRDAAIVTDIPGTTRDILEVSMDLEGMLIRFQDTAGIRESGDAVEKIGVERAVAAAEHASLILWLLPLGGSSCVPCHQISFGKEIVNIFTKSDLVEKFDQRRQDGIVISSHTGAGISELLQFIALKAKSVTGRADLGIVFQERQKQWLERSIEGLSGAIVKMGNSPVELVCEELRFAKEALERIVGKIGTEDILGEIFSRFCIGK